MSVADILSVAPPPIRVLDIGAMAEGKDRYQPLLDRGLAEVTGFEPDDASREKLNLLGGPRKYLPQFLGDGGSATFHRTRYPGCSSLLEPDPAVIDLFGTISATPPGGNFAVVERIPVQTTRLDDVPDLGRVDFLKVDVQGAELVVLENGTRTLSNVLVVETEVEFLALYKGQPLFGDLQCFFREQGFVLHRLVDLAGRSLHPLSSPNPYVPLSQWLWADAVFVRDFTHLEQYSDENLIRAALILADVYHSPDLAFRMLAEHDSRYGGEQAVRYVKTLHKVRHTAPWLTVRDHP